MRAYLYSFVVGSIVGVIYGAVRVKRPAPPVVALVGLLGMVAGEERFSLLKEFIRERNMKMADTHSTEIATARFVDHIWMTVPDQDGAIQFFEDALGARLLWRVGPFHETFPGVAIESVEIAMLRLRPSINLELLAYVAETQRRLMPSNIDRLFAACKSQSRPRVVGARPLLVHGR